MRALVVTRNLPPLIGGMERLVWHIVDALSGQYKVHVIGPKGCGAMLPAGVTATEVPLSPIWLFLLRIKLEGVIRALKYRPELVFAGSGLTAPFAWLAARLSGAKCVVYLHGLDIEARHLAYRWFWRPFFKRFDLVLVNSQFTRALALEAGVSEERIHILYPGVELPSLNGAEQQRAMFRQRYRLGDRPILLYVGRITARKGLLTFVQGILPGLLKERPDLKLVVVGSEPRMALNREHSLMEQIQTVIGKNALEGAVLFLGDVTDEELHATYFGSDVLVFPVQEKKWDHEGFGMVAVEAAAHGLPTVAFAVGGVTDAVSDGQSGRLIPESDHSAFAQAVLEMINKGDGGRIIRFAEGFSWSRFNEQLLQVIGKLH